MEENKVPLLSSLAEWVRSALAIFVVFFGLAIIAYAWGLRGISDAKELSAVLLGMVGIVLGYYFGSKGVDKAQDIAKQEAEDSKLQQLRTSNYDALKSKFVEYQGEVAEYARLMDEISKDNTLKAKVQELLAKIQGGADQ